MNYASASAFRMALEKRLLHEHRTTGVALSRLRKIVAFDRLLARLAAEGRSDWVLKGGFSLQVMLPDRARTTKDIDLHIAQSAAEATRMLRDASALDLGDFFTFMVGAGNAGEARGIRFGVECRVDGRGFETFHVDVGAEEPMVGAPLPRMITPLLAFADVTPVIFPCCPLGQHLAEKVHALTRPHGKRDNSRSKDLVDIVLLAETARIDAAELTDALTVTFAACGTHPIPSTLSSVPRSWASEYRRSARELELRTDTLEEAERVASALVNPVLTGHQRGLWSADSLNWESSSETSQSGSLERP